MSNISDAFGTIRVEKVGREFKDFLDIAQKDAYYKLVEEEDYRDQKPDAKNCLEFKFSTPGRNAYDCNIDGFLGAEWLKDEAKQAYDAFIRALKEKQGLVEITYTDSESSNFWMGEGNATLQFSDGELSFVNEFDSEETNVKRYSEMTRMTEHEALEALHGEDALAAYYKYVSECEQEGETPDNIDDWYEEYEG